MPRRTALLVEVPETEPFVRELRLQHDWSAARGVPAHVTILFPFAHPDEVDEQALQELFGRFHAFDFELDRVERFDDGVVWLHPQPSLPFVDLTAAVAERFPEHPPYEGAFDVVIPHLTVSEQPVEVSVPLPIASRAHEVSLFDEDETTGHWSRRRTFALR